MSAFNTIINNNTTPSLSTSNTSANQPFSYIGMFDLPLGQDPLPTSYARSILNRASLTPSLGNLSDSGALLMYFMLEGLGNNQSDEQHGIENPSLYITDMVFQDVEEPANTCCPIRMDVFTDASEVTQINKCKHLFCREGIRTWLETHHTCPLCRTSIDN
jgi:hypothetical protein